MQLAAPKSRKGAGRAAGSCCLALLARFAASEEQAAGSEA